MSFYPKQATAAGPLVNCLGWLQWWATSILISTMPRHFSLSLSITNTPAAAYNIQPTATPAFSFPVSTTIPHLTILEFIFGQ
jgi:hypothetical protein